MKEVLHIVCTAQHDGDRIKLTDGLHRIDFNACAMADRYLEELLWGR